MQKARQKSRTQPAGVEDVLDPSLVQHYLEELRLAANAQTMQDGRMKLDAMLDLVTQPPPARPSAPKNSPDAINAHKEAQRRKVAWVIFILSEIELGLRPMPDEASMVKFRQNFRLRLAKALAADDVFRGVQAEGHKLADDGAPPKMYETWLRQRRIPAWNGLFGHGLRLCADCGGKYAPHDKRDRYCSKACRDRSANRGRERVGSGKSQAEAARWRNEKRLRRHLETCVECKIGQRCATREALIDTDDALNRRSHLDLDQAEQMKARRKIR